MMIKHRSRERPTTHLADTLALIHASISPRPHPDARRKFYLFRDFPLRIAL